MMRIASGTVLLLLFVGMFTFTSSLKQVGSTSSSWWNSNWQDRIEVNITENSGYNLTDFPIEITFEHNGNIQTNGTDIRVVDNSLEIPSHVEGCNSTHATIISEINLTASESKTIYIYYGNPNATTPSYPLVPLTISEGNTGNATIDNSVFIGWDYTSWGWSNNVELWNDFRIDFNGNNNPMDDSDLIRNYSSRQGGIGRFRGDINAIGLGNYQKYVQTSIYVDINFADAKLRVYHNHPWVETTQADTLHMFSSSYDYEKFGQEAEQNIIDGQGINIPEGFATGFYSKSNPGWMAFRDSSSGYVFASTGFNIGSDYAYHQGGKEASDYDRAINYNNRTRYDPVLPYDQPPDCRIYWYGDDTNNYSSIETMAQVFNNQPSIVGPHVIIDQAFVSDERADINSTQTVGFHAKWDNGSDVVGGTLRIESVSQNISGLVGYWKFDEGIGTIAYDSSGNNNNGTLEYGPMWTSGKYGNALSFDGIDDYVMVPDSQSLRVQSFTLEAWIYMTARPYQAGHPSHPHVCIINKLHYYNTAAKTGYKLDFEYPTATDDTLVISVGDGVAQRFLAQYNSINDLTLNQWHQVVGTYDGSTAKIYIDGHLKATGQGSYTIAHDGTPLCVSREISQPVYDGFNGIIDEVRVYNKALTEEEVKMLLPLTYAQPDSEEYVTNATGWINADVSSSVIGKSLWTVDKVNCSGVATYVQTSPNPSTIWDRIMISDGGLTNETIMLGQTTVVWFKAAYEYDKVVFDGTKGSLYVNSSAMSWSTTNDRWEYNYTATTSGSEAFVISGVSDELYSLSVINDTIAAKSVAVLEQPILVASCRSSTSFVGFKVEINGNLTCRGEGLSGASVFLSYSVTGGTSWSDLTLVNTGSDGSYSAEWFPSVTGNYLIRAVWDGNSSYSEASTTVNLAVTPFAQKNVFSVASNSTVSELVFNSTSRELSFTVTGPSGTTGYVDVCIAKTIIDEVTKVKVYLDGNETNYTLTSDDESWLLHLAYQHSSHEVVVSLGSQARPFIETPFGIVSIVLGILAVAVAVTVVVLRKRTRKH